MVPLFKKSYANEKFMFSLIQIIFFLNTNTLPQVNLITSFDKAHKCEKRIIQVYQRYKSSTYILSLGNDEEKLKYLKVENLNDPSISYWTCKKQIF